MGHFRFRRSFGNQFLKLNVSKTGFSITGGVPGAHVNADLSGRRKKPFVNTFGIPGSGLSYRTDSYGPDRATSQGPGTLPIWLQGLAFVIGALFLIGLFL